MSESRDDTDGLFGKLRRLPLSILRLHWIAPEPMIPAPTKSSREDDLPDS